VRLVRGHGKTLKRDARGCYCALDNFCRKGQMPSYLTYFFQVMVFLEENSDQRDAGIKYFQCLEVRDMIGGYRFKWLDFSSSDMIIRRLPFYRLHRRT
jgi:hypothetical protein